MASFASNQGEADMKAKEIVAYSNACKLFRHTLDVSSNCGDKKCRSNELTDVIILTCRSLGGLRGW